MGAEPSRLQPLLAQIDAEIRSGELQLPLLPTVVGEVLAGTMDEDKDATGLAGLIQQDQALAAHIMRVVNSPSFRGANEIVALQQAITRLGMERIREIALSVSLKGSLFKEGPYDAYLRDVWRDSLSTGLWAKEVARARRKNVETSYLCGLLNNVGAPVLVHRLSMGESLPEVADVVDVVNALGAAAGVALANAWNLPDFVATSIEHTPDFAAAGEAQDTVAIVVTAQALTCRLHTGINERTAHELVQLPELQHLNLYPEDVEALLAMRERVHQELDAMSL